MLEKNPPQYRTCLNLLGYIRSRPACANLDQKPARQFHPGDVGEAGALADGDGVGGPGSGEVQPGEKRHEENLLCDVQNNTSNVIYYAPVC